MIRLAFTLMLASSAVFAQDRSPATLMGSLILIVVVAEECRLPITSDERQRIAAAGQRLQDQLGMSDQAVESLGQQIARDADGIECSNVGATFAEVLRETLAEAERVR